MVWYKIIALAALAICFLSLTYHAVRLIRLGIPADYSRKAGNTPKAIAYSFVGAMSPIKKESAYMHLPTYLAGVLFHAGIFIAILLFFISLFNIQIGHPYSIVIAAMLTISAVCGLSMLIKRIASVKLRTLSSPDDYISNLLVTIFQLFTALALVFAGFEGAWYISATVLMLYIPLGKLKHVVYFFAARFHLGFFYGWRGVWPPQKH